MPRAPHGPADTRKQQKKTIDIVTGRSDEDRRWMAAALRLAHRGLGRTWPNPSVGAILVQGSPGAEHIVGRAVTAPGGRPHAETLAIAEAGERARGATLYVTLEPCSHHGRTPPCVDAIIGAGIGRVVGAMTDPDPRVAGRGYQILREAGIDVVTGVLERESIWHNRGHICRITNDRPHTLLKLAISADGGIGREGDGQVAITGAAVKRDVHLARAECDAIMVGVGTVVADDPQLTCRIPGLEHWSPVRVVLDTNARTLLDLKLVRGAGETPTWIIAASDAPTDRVEALRQAGVRVLTVARDEGGHVSMAAALRALGGEGVTSVLVEGGARMAKCLITEDLADLIDFYHSPRRIGAGAIAALNGLPLETVTDGERYVCVRDRRVGEDLLRQYKRAA